MAQPQQQNQENLRAKQNDRTVRTINNKNKLRVKDICANFISEPRLLNLKLLNLIVRWPSECSHYINNLWNATFGL